jgi:TRAP-type transport system periplasmic protein
MSKRFVLSVVTFLFVCIMYHPGSHAQTTLRFSSFMSPESAPAENYALWAKEIEEKSKGRLKVAIYPSEALGKARDHYEMVSQGIVDIAWFTLGFTPGRFPLSSVLELPMEMPSSTPISLTVWDIFEKYLQPEFKEVKILALYALDPYVVYTTRKPVRKLEDIKGMKIRAAVPMQIKITQAWGAAPVQLPTSDVYDGMNRGLVEGALLPYAAIKDLRAHEVSKYITDVKLFSYPCGYGINKKVYDGLPADLKKIIDEVSGRRIAERGGKIIDGITAQNLQLAKKAGVEQIPLTPAERARWLKACDPVIEESIKDLEGKGLPAKKVYEEAKMILKKYSTNP